MAKYILSNEQKARKSELAKKRRAECAERVLAIEQASREKHRDRKNAWNAANKNPEYFRQHHAARKDDPAFKAQRNAYDIAYRQRNKAEISEKRRARRAANPEMVTRGNHARRARKLSAGGVLSRGIVAKLMQLQKGVCVNCRVDLKAAGKHLDHIEPLARGGSNSDENVQLLCPSCNTSKHTKDPVAWAQSQGRLL